MFDSFSAKLGNKNVIYRAFWNTLLTMTVSELTSSLAVLIDGVILARFIGGYAVAAHGLIMPYSYFIKLLGGIFATGTQVVCSGEIGKGDLNSADRVFSSSFRLLMILTAAIGALIAVFSGTIGIVFGAGRDMENLFRPTSDYLRGLAVGLPVTAGNMMLIPIVALNGDKKRISLATTVMMAVNIAGDLINVFFLDGSMLGMALATTISYVCSFTILLLHFKDNKGIRFCKGRPDMRGMNSVFRSGILSSFVRVCSLIKSYLINIIYMTYAGTAVLAANSLVQSNVKVVFICIATAVGQTTLIMTGILYGEEDRRGIGTMFRTVLAIALGPCVILSAIIFAFAPQIVLIFGSKELAGLASTALRVFIVGFPLITLKIFYINYFQGAKKTNLSRLSSLFGELVFITVNSFLFVRRFGTFGLWLAYPVSELMYLLLFGIVCTIQLGHVPRSLDELLFLPPDFDVPEADKMDYQIHSREEVLQMSEQARVFCREHGISERKSFHVALAVEELAYNIFEHGFDDGKEHFVDLKLLHKENMTKIRLRDDCRMFNPQEKVAVLSPEDKKKGIGLRMIFSVSADPKEMNVSYVNVLNLNNLIITVPDM